MAIIYYPNKKIFTLHTAHTTYQMQVDPLGYLLHLYYGDKTNSPMDYVLTYACLLYTSTYQGKIAGSFVSADTYLVIPEGVYRCLLYTSRCV